MNNNLIIKEVDFNGDNLLAIKSQEKIYVAIYYVCKAIGLSKGQTDTQVKKIQNDIVLNKGCKMLGVKNDAQIRSVFCIENDYLPLWLAKINANIIKEKVIQDKLIEYQLRAKDILANAFNYRYSVPQTFAQALRLASDLQLQLEEQQPKVEAYNLLISANGLYNMKQVADLYNVVGRNTLMKYLREKQILSSNKFNKNLPYKRYDNYFNVKITPIRTSNGLENICTTLCTTKGLKLIEKVLNEKGLLSAKESVQ